LVGHVDSSDFASLSLLEPSSLNPEELSKCKPKDLMKIRGLGIRRVGVIAEALESLGVIGDAEEWLR
jgi:hypothetical protein